MACKSLPVSPPFFDFLLFVCINHDYLIATVVLSCGGEEQIIPSYGELFRTVQDVLYCSGVLLAVRLIFKDLKI